MSDASNRIPTYVNGLDQQMQGGIPQGHIVLLAGVSGSMKSLASVSLYSTTLSAKDVQVEFTSLLSRGRNHLEATWLTWEWM